jgi:hypothetical protein
MTRAPISSRDLPAPWGVCDVCGETAGLPDPDSSRLFTCGRCATERAQMNAAQDDLEALTGPMIGAWAAHWTRAGLTLKQLEEVAEWATAAWMSKELADTFRAARLRFLRRRHGVPAFIDEPPTRQTFAPDALARVVAYWPGHPWPTFETADGARHTLPGGLDAVILEEANGSRAVVFTGQAGHLSFERVPALGPPGFRVPAALWPAFALALSGEEKDVPSFAVYARGQP